MTTLLFVRHGESEANLKDLFAGHFDAVLTARGREQAVRTAAFLKEKYAVDVIYSSDLQRTIQTAQPIADIFQLPIIPDESLREISAGEWEGVHFYSIKDTHAQAFHVFMNDLGNAVCPGGESVAEMDARVFGTVCRIAKENDGKTVVIVTHATPTRALQCRFMKKPLPFIQQISWVSNASVTEVQYDNGEFSLQKVSQDAHLADILTTLPTDI